MNHTCYLDQCGSIVNATSGNRITSPSVLIAPEDDIIHRFGDSDLVYPAMIKYTETYKLIGKTPPVMLTFDKEQLSNSQICYLLRRMTEFTGTGFIKEFWRHYNQSNFKNWLNTEIKRIPIDLAQQEWK